MTKPYSISCECQYMAGSAPNGVAACAKRYSQSGMIDERVTAAQQEERTESVVEQRAAVHISVSEYREVHGT